MGRIRDSSTLAAGQRSEIGRYEVHTEVSLPGFGIGMINVWTQTSLILSLALSLIVGEELVLYVILVRVDGDYERGRF